MAGSEQPYVDYYFRKERLGDDGGQCADARIVGVLPEAILSEGVEAISLSELTAMFAND